MIDEVATEHADSRTHGRRAVCESVSPGLWRANYAFTRELMCTLRQHRFVQHPLIAAMNGGRGSSSWLRRFYLETWHALSGSFVDRLLRAVLNCGQLEPRLGIDAVVAARFLLQINVADELGFVPGAIDGQFVGQPCAAHSAQLFAVMRQLGIGERAVREHRPSPSARAVASILDGYGGDHLCLAVLLSTLESTLDPWTECWARATKLASEVDVERGYHAIHVENDHGEAIDDDHAEDGWFIVCQALVPERRDEARQVALSLLDVCATYADHQLEDLLRMNPVHALRVSA